jgi:hypothetical protein
MYCFCATPLTRESEKAQCTVCQGTIFNSAPYIWSWCFWEDFGWYKITPTMAANADVLREMIAFPPNG